jgi:glutaminase
VSEAASLRKLSYRFGVFVFTLKLDKWLELARKEVSKGKLPSYIPLLTEVDQQKIAIAIQYLNKAPLIAGDINSTFPLMSVVKPFLLLYLLETKGNEVVFNLVDRQASSQSFNAIPDRKPQNPMLNSGAIALSSLLVSYENLQDWLNQRSGANLTIDLEMLDSVRSVANRRNLAIADQLKHLGIVAEPLQALAVYEEICCLQGSVQDLMKIGTLLIDTRRSPHASSNIATVLKIMTDCGMYAASAAFAQDIGLPSKSSVSGALLSIIPDQAAIACYGPTLDAIGNSVAGLFLIRQIKNQT